MSVEKRTPISVKEAIKRIMKQHVEVKNININLDESLGHILAEDIVAFKEGEICIPTIGFYTLSTFPFIEKALNSNHLSLKHVFKQLSTDWLDVTEIDSPYYWYKNINFQHDLDSLKMQINE